MRLTNDTIRPTREDSSRKPIYNEASTAGPEPPPAQKRPLSTHIPVAPSRSLSQLKTLTLSGTQMGDDVPMRDVSEDSQIEQPRKRAAIGDGISAGSGSPLPFRDSESPPPRRSKARPTSAPYGSSSEAGMMRSGNADEIVQRSYVGKKTLWTPDQEPLSRSSLDPPSSNVASIQTQKSRNQALQSSKSRKPYQSPQQAIAGNRLPASQTSPNPTPATSGRSTSQISQNQPQDELYDIVLQPETRPISQEQLVAEVKGSGSSFTLFVSFPPITSIFFLDLYYAVVCLESASHETLAGNSPFLLVNILTGEPL